MTYVIRVFVKSNLDDLFVLWYCIGRRTGQLPRGLERHLLAYIRMSGGGCMSKNDLFAVLALARKCGSIDEFIQALLEIIYHK